MTPVELAAERLLDDLRGILSRDGSVLLRFQAVEDRVMAAEREMEAARLGVHAALLQHMHGCASCGSGPVCAAARAIADCWTPPTAEPRVTTCTCGEPDCHRGVCVDDAPEAA